MMDPDPAKLYESGRIHIRNTIIIYNYFYYDWPKAIFELEHEQVNTVPKQYHIFSRLSVKIWFI